MQLLQTHETGRVALRWHRTASSRPGVHKDAAQVQTSPQVPRKLGAPCAELTNFCEHSQERLSPGVKDFRVEKMPYNNVRKMRGASVAGGWGVARRAMAATMPSNSLKPMEPTDLPKNLGRRLGDLSDLPEALRAQIVVTKLDDLEAKIIKTMTDRFEGVANVDEIIVGLFRDHQYITEDRRQLANKLYRMQKASLLDAVPKRKGVYKVKEQTVEDSTEL